MLVVEMNVINAAKAWKRAETAAKRKHWEKMLRIAVEVLEGHEKPKTRKLALVPKPRPKTKLRVVK